VAAALAALNESVFATNTGPPTHHKWFRFTLGNPPDNLYLVKSKSRP